MAAPGPDAQRRARHRLLQGVLELAVGVARHDAADDPGAVPPLLRPVLKLSRLGPRSLDAADRAGDDDAFRARVAALVGPDDLGPAERLWLARPEGWEAELATLVEAAAAEAEQGDARRSLDRERRARAAAERARDEARTELDRARAQAEAGRAERTDAVRERADAVARADAAEAERARAVRSLKDLEAAHARVHAEVRALRESVEVRSEAPRVPDPPPGASEPSPALAPVPSEAPGVQEPPPGASEPSPLDREQLARAVGAAARAASELAASLAEVAALVEPPPAAVEAPPPSPAPRPRRPRPAPARLPGGLHDDSPEAAAHLARLPGAVLLVDGYNISMATWPDVPIADQRRRLVAALDALEARVGLDVTVVFDGVDQSARRTPSRRVQVRFTDEGVEADDVVLDLAGALAGERPVLVASDDGRVRDGATARGANVLSVAQLQTLIA